MRRAAALVAMNISLCGCAYAPTRFQPRWGEHAHDAHARLEAECRQDPRRYAECRGLP